MKHVKFFLILLLLSFACASLGVKNRGDRRDSVSPGGVKGLKLVGIIGGTRLGTSTLYLPTGIAVDLLGNVFITDTGNDRVVKCDGEGRFVTEVGGFGWEPGEFNRPTYIATDNGLNVYVVDAQNNRIQRFDRNLNFISAIELKERKDSGGFGLPEGIGLTPSGEILVSDIETDCLIKLDAFFEYERTIGGFESMEGGLRDPSGISIGRNGNIYVADSQNDRVVVFDPFGNFLKSFGKKILKDPKAVAVGPDHLIFVANTGKNTIAIFDTDGKLVLEYGDQESEMMNLSRPTDIQPDRENRLFVVDSGNNRILIFEIIR